MPKVTVKIAWPEGAHLPDQARARITVEDVSNLDAAAVVVGETVLDDLDADRPAECEVEVDEVDEGTNLIVRVHVADGSRSPADRQVEVGDLLSTESHPVLTRGHGDSVVVRPRQIG